MIFDSNTTLVKVKYRYYTRRFISEQIQIQHLLKLNTTGIVAVLDIVSIQIQHLLKLNDMVNNLSNKNNEFKYNTC